MKQLTLIFLALLCQIQLLQAQCTEDCVWPGDLNANGIANHIDILALGLAYGETGPARTDMSTMWDGLNADDWANSLPILGANFKHCDADGDGEITELDRLPISINFNLTNDNFSGLLGNNLVGDDLFIVPQNTVASPGGSLIFDIHLGTADAPIENLHGIGFQVDIETEYIADVLFDFSDSWIGVDEEILGYGKYSDDNEFVGTAITRIDGMEASGFGKIMQLEIVITDVILGLEADSTACLPFPIHFRNVLAIDQEEGDLMVTTNGDSLTLKHPSQLTNTKQIEAKTLDFKAFPNPAHDILQIATFGKIVESITLFNQLGQPVFQKKLSHFDKNNGQFNIPVAALPRGIYFLEIQNKDGKGHRKILLE